MRAFCFRFDVDTHRCIREGVPRLLEMAEEEGVKFTFFVNMGRAVSLATSLRTSGRRQSASATAPKLSARQKLGFRGYLTAAILNPSVGAGSADLVRALGAAGHEVGLHGGRNHAVWQTGASTWPRDRLVNEVAYGLERLKVVTGAMPAGFASPGFHGPPALPSVLASMDFDYVSDQHGPDAGPPAICEDGMLSIPTRLTGEPGGVAYLEWGRARGLDRDAILEEFSGHLDTEHPFLVVYDHPYFAGIHEIETVRGMIRLVRERGFQVTTLETIARRQRGE